MIFKIKAGKHRAWPLYWIKWWVLVKAPTIIKRRIMFDVTSKYYIPGEDMEDLNKLFGVGFGGVHKNSVRFGWRYNPENMKVSIFKYSYTNGVRDEFYHITDVNLYVKYDFVLEVTKYSYCLKVMAIGGYSVEVRCDKGHDRKWGVLLGPFFGGNKPAPQKIEIRIDKI